MFLVAVEKLNPVVQRDLKKLTRPERKLALQCTSMCLDLVKRDQELWSEIGDPELRTDALALYFESEERIFRA